MDKEGSQTSVYGEAKDREKGYGGYDVDGQRWMYS